MEKRTISLASSRRMMLMLLTPGTLYHFLYCTMLSSALGVLPVLGGAMFTASRLSQALVQTLWGDSRKYLTRRMRAVFVALSGVMLLLTCTLLLLYPALWSTLEIWILFAVVLLIQLRFTAVRRLAARRMRKTISARAFYLLLAAAALAPLGAAAWMLAGTSASGWQLWGGFAAGSLLEGYSLWRERDLLALDGLPDDIDRETVDAIAQELRGVNAYSAYQRLHMLVLTALQLTQVMAAAFIGLNAGQLLTCMLVTAAAAILMREVSALCVRLCRRPVDTQLLLFGLFLWLYGIFLLYRQTAAAPDLLWSVLALALCVSGLTISITALAELERRMTDVAQFRLQNRMHGYAQMRAAATEMAMLLGQMIALILLTALCLPGGFRLPMPLPLLRPVMIAPALLLALWAIPSALRFPLKNRHFQKLARWLTLEKEGLDNPALRRQLDSVVVRRHKNRFGVRVIITLLRPLYYHKVIGRENLAPYENGSMILVCNHGEIYGPVVANLYIPIDFRPWVLSRMMDKEAIVEHMYYGTMERQRWLPESWKRPLIRMLTPVLVWVFESLEAIPVYRGQPRELMRTFRETLDAMQAGDNILLFPENADEHEEGKSGFIKDGIGDFYTGFAMIAPMYWAKTKKRAVFVPIYANRKKRTLTIGSGIVYRPEAGANDEKLRIARELHLAMQHMSETP